MLDHLETQLGESLIAAAPTNWARIDLRTTVLSTVADLRATAVLADDSTVPLELPPGFLMTLNELRDAQWEPNTGSWVALRLLIDPPGEYVAYYNFELTPDWAPAVTAAQYAEDMRPFPRKPEQVPFWWNGREPDFGDRERILVRIGDVLKFSLPAGSASVRVTAAAGTHPTALVRTVNDTEQAWTPPLFLDELLRRHRAAGEPWNSATVDFVHRGHPQAEFS